MRTASGLILVTIGAILAFAVTSQPSFLNLHVTGWVFMAVGIAGMNLPRRGRGWLRRRVVVRGPGARDSKERIERNRLRARPNSGGPVPPRGGPGELAGEGEAERGGRGAGTTAPCPAEETVEEFIEE